jgi:hypothetical protein
MRRLLGVLGRARADLIERLLVSLCNSMVLPHLQFCLMMRGNFEAERNKAQGETLPKLQKRFVGIIVGQGGRYHADSLLAKYGILKVGDLYWQQLRMHTWKFHNNRLPDSQTAMLAKVGSPTAMGQEPHAVGCW